MENKRGDIRGQSIKYKKLQTLMYHINKETLIKEHLLLLNIEELVIIKYV